MYGQRVRVALSERLTIFDHLPRRSASVGSKRTPSEGPTTPRPTARRGRGQQNPEEKIFRTSECPSVPSERPSEQVA